MTKEVFLEQQTDENSIVLRYRSSRRTIAQSSSPRRKARTGELRGILIAQAIETRVRFAGEIRHYHRA